MSTDTPHPRDDDTTTYYDDPLAPRPIPDPADFPMLTAKDGKKISAACLLRNGGYIPDWQAVELGLLTASDIKPLNLHPTGSRPRVPAAPQPAPAPATPLAPPPPAAAPPASSPNTEPGHSIPSPTSSSASVPSPQSSPLPLSLPVLQPAATRPSSASPNSVPSPQSSALPPARPALIWPPNVDRRKFPKDYDTDGLTAADILAHAERIGAIFGTQKRDHHDPSGFGLYNDPKPKPVYPEAIPLQASQLSRARASATSQPHNLTTSPSSPPPPDHFTAPPRHLSLLAGPAGIGKSLLALDLAARYTRGEMPPDPRSLANSGARGPLPQTPRPVVILSAEDRSDDLVDRLIALRANLDFVFLIDSIIRPEPKKGQKPPEDPTELRFPEDKDIFQNMIQSIGDVALVIIDPLPTFFTESHLAHRHVRRAMESLEDIALMTDVAIVGISHTKPSLYIDPNDPAKKTANKPRVTSHKHSLIGALAFTSRARQILTLDHAPPALQSSCPPSLREGAGGRESSSPNPDPASSPDTEPGHSATSPTSTSDPSPPHNPTTSPPSPDPTRPSSLVARHSPPFPLLLRCIKSNLPAPPPTRLLSVTFKGIDFGPIVPTLPPAPTTSLEEGEDEDERWLVEEAMEFLREELKNGPQPGHPLIGTGATLGHTRRTLRRARKRLGVVARKVGNQRTRKSYWVWSFPQHLQTPQSNASQTQQGPNNVSKVEGGQG